MSISLRMDHKAGREWLTPNQCFRANVWDGDQVPCDPFPTSGRVRYLVPINEILTHTTSLYFVGRDRGHTRTFVELLAIDHGSTARTQFPATEALRLKSTSDDDTGGLPNPFLYYDQNSKQWQVSSNVYVSVEYVHEVRVDDEALKESRACIYEWQDKDSGKVIRPRKRAGESVDVYPHRFKYN